MFNQRAPTLLCTWKTTNKHIKKYHSSDNKWVRGTNYFMKPACVLSPGCSLPAQPGYICLERCVSALLLELCQVIDTGAFISPIQSSRRQEGQGGPLSAAGSFPLTQCPTYHLSWCVNRHTPWVKWQRVGDNTPSKTVHFAHRACC